MLLPFPRERDPAGGRRGVCDGRCLDAHVRGHFHQRQDISLSPGKQPPQLSPFDCPSSYCWRRCAQDSGQPTDMEVEDFSGEREPPQFSLKCGYVLTDTPEAGMANT